MTIRAKVKELTSDSNGRMIFEFEDGIEDEVYALKTDMSDIKDSKAVIPDDIKLDDATDLESAIALVNELKAVINSMKYFS